VDADAGVEEDVAAAVAGRAIAALVILGSAVALAGLPALIGFGVAPRPVGQVAVALGSLVAVSGGVKLTAVCWGLVARVESSPAPQTPAASID